MKKCYLNKNLKVVKSHIKIFPSIENSQHNVLRLEYTWNTQKTVNKSVWLHNSE